MTEKTVISFVCMGNICRSPTAEIVFKKCIENTSLSTSVHIDSFATHSYHIGKPPDERAISIGAKFGYDLTPLRAQKFTLDVLKSSHYILAMDKNNILQLQQDYGLKETSCVQLFLNFHSTMIGEDLPDPYYEDEHAFEKVVELAEDAAQGLLKHIQKQHQQ